MIYKKAPKVEEELSAIGIGCWNFGGDWDSSGDDNSTRIVHAAIDSGINFFDVAPVYGFYHSETVLGKILKEGNLRNKIVLASKCGILWDESRNTHFDLSKKSILEEIDQSLTRLQTDHIDIYQLHWPDPHTPIEETVEALKEIKAAGKIRYVGLSNFSIRDIEIFESMIEVNSQQSLYNMLERNTNVYHDIPLEYKTEKEILPHVKEKGQVFLPYSPLFQGLLSGKFKGASHFSQKDIRNANSKFHGDTLLRYLAVAEELKGFAGRIGKPLNEVAMNWLRQKPEVTSIIAGVSSTEQLKANLNCLTWDLDEEMLREIDQIIAPFENV